MNNNIFDFFEEFNVDCDNLFVVYDYLILEKKNEIENYINLISNEEKINEINKGIFSIKINKKYLLLIKNDLENFFEKIYKFLLKNKNFDNNFIFSFDLIKNIFSFCNLVLIFNDNSTFYSIKKRILINLSKNIKKKEEINQIIFSEYSFTSITNKNKRKSCISFHYRFFLLENFKENLNINLINNLNIQKLKLQNSIFDLNNIEKNIIFKDIENINLVNIKQNRNYHMWTYLNLLFNSEKTSEFEKKIILSYSIFLLKLCAWDYSSFSFIINNYYKIKNININLIIDEFNQNFININQEHKNYILNLIEYLKNK